MEANLISEKTISRLRFLLAGACVLSGLLAGATIDRLIIGLPTWRSLGVLSWAEYSRLADMGKGIFIYPPEAIGSFLLLLMSSILLTQSKSMSFKKRFSLPVHTATVFALAGLVLTFFAAPFMLSIRNMYDRELLEFAFNKFYYWSTFRGIAHVLSFLACIWAMARAFASGYSNG